jgi:methionyl-tRNA formyltransferase
MGSPGFAVPSLRALHERYRLAGVVTQPDRPAGRGRRLAPSAVKQAAQALGLPTQQPPRLRAPEALAALREWSPDLIVVAAFGQILPQSVLDLPAHGCLNVHASLLPRHRGAAPVAAALLAGDAETGVTIMQMDAGLDTGPVLATRVVAVRSDDTAGTLAKRLGWVGADLLVETLPVYLAGDLRPEAQDSSQATYAGQLRKEDGLLDWGQSAEALARRVRAFSPWPGAFALWQGQPLKILRARAMPESSAAPGLVVEAGQDIAVGTGAGVLVFEEVQPAGRRPMAAGAFARGARGFVGSVLAGPTVESDSLAAEAQPSES